MNRESSAVQATKSQSPLPSDSEWVEGNRLTLVIKPGYDEVTTLYCLSAFETIEEARENLRERERTENIGNIGYLNFIDGSYCVRNPNKFVIDKLIQWNLDKNFDAAIWSDFSPKFSDLRLPFALAKCN